MEKEQIYSTLDKMLENPKSKTFLNHLVKSYMPITNVEKVWDKPKSDFKCVISRDSLFSIQDILEGMQTEEYKKDFMTFLKSMFDEKADRTTPMAKLVGEKKLGVTGKDTTTFMSLDAFQGFYEWVIDKAFKGDKHINWLLGGIRHSAFIERASRMGDVDIQNKAAKKENAKTATFSLGDASDALSKLKAELESKGK